MYQRLGRMARRGRERVFAVPRHCERSEAIHSSFARRDGLLRFARNDGLLWLFRKLNTSTPHSQSSSPANGSAEWPPDDRLRRAIQYSETSVMESKGHSVLDTPHARAMTAFSIKQARHRLF